MLDEEDSDCGDNGGEEDEVASQCLDIEEDHMGEIEEQLLHTPQALHHHRQACDDDDGLPPTMMMLDGMAAVDDDPPTFCYPSMMQDDEVYFNLQNAEHSSVGTGLCYDQSSISDSIGQFTSRQTCEAARMGSAFFTPRNNLC